MPSNEGLRSEQANSRSHPWREELSGSTLSASLNAAVVLYLLEMIITLSVVALIYQGDLAVHLTTVTGAALIGNAVLVMVVYVFRSYEG